MHKLNQHQYQNDHAIWNKISLIISVFSLLTIFLGVSGIVEHKSPEAMANLDTLANGFLTYVEYHVLIIAGALGFTFSIWLIEKN